MTDQRWCRVIAHALTPLQKGWLARTARCTAPSLGSQRRRVFSAICQRVLPRCPSVSVLLPPPAPAVPPWRSAALDASQPSRCCPSGKSKSWCGKPMKRSIFHLCRAFMGPSPVPIVLLVMGGASRFVLHLSICQLVADAERWAGRHLLTYPLFLHSPLPCLGICFPPPPPPSLFLPFFPPYAQGGPRVPLDCQCCRARQPCAGAFLAQRFAAEHRGNDQTAIGRRDAAQDPSGPACCPRP